MMRVLHVGKFYPPHAGGIEAAFELVWGDENAHWRRC